jgi:hypothetical protein
MRETAVDVNDLRQGLQRGWDDGDFALLHVWVRFWANGGCACSADIEAFVQGVQRLSDNDALVLGVVVEELRHT